MNSVTSSFTRVLVVLLAAAACIQAREPWTTSRLVGSPDPQPPYRVERVYPSLSFQRPVTLQPLPRENRILVLENGGRILSFVDEPDAASVDEVIDLRTVDPQLKSAFDLTLDPDFESNRYVYVAFSTGPDASDGSRIVRFTLSQSNPPVFLPDSRRDIFRWPSGGHNGCCLRFGPDGYLYFSAGDGAGPFPPDPERTAQDLSDIRGSIVRIDVHAEDEELPYRIPADNPFLDVAKARGEIWAFGFRNPWRFSFDPKDGALYSGDVGWERWEMVHRVERGGNYGWSIVEGPQPIHPDDPRGPGPLLPPLLAIDHTESQSITGGLVYRGQRFPELEGVFLFGDYANGSLWGMDVDAAQLSVKQTLAATGLAIISFATRDGDDVLILDYGGGVYELVENETQDTSADFPRLLSQTGLFTSLADLTPSPGVIPYQPAARIWLDGTDSQAYVAIPSDQPIVPHNNPVHWQYPAGTVLAKTIFDSSQPNARRLETQVLLHDGTEWNPYTYAWNDHQTDADLVSSEGAQTTRLVEDPVDGAVEVPYRFYSRTECRVCHNHRAGGGLGFELSNLDHQVLDDDGTSLSQLQRLIDAGVLADKGRAEPVFVDPYDLTADLDRRARSYLAINCANCHRRGGGGTSPLELPLDQPLANTNALDAKPTQGDFGIRDARVIAPGDPYRSVLYYRLATAGPGSMPRLGGRTTDVAGVQLIHDWIASLAPTTRDDGEKNDASASSVERALRMAHAADRGRTSADVVQRAARHYADSGDLVAAGILERFLPADQRQRRLGAVVDREQMLGMRGDPAAGRAWFVESSASQCRSCHRADGVGRAVGPDLDKIATRRTPAALLDSLLDPNKEVEPAFQAYSVLTVDGQQLTGLVVERTDAAVTLRAADGTVSRIPADSIERMQPQPQSLMPSGLVETMTAEQLADLLAYLSSLR